MIDTFGFTGHCDPNYIAMLATHCAVCRRASGLRGPLSIVITSETYREEIRRAVDEELRRRSASLGDVDVISPEQSGHLLGVRIQNLVIAFPYVKGGDHDAVDRWILERALCRLDPVEGGILCLGVATSSRLFDAIRNAR